MAALVSHFALLFYQHTAASRLESLLQLIHFIRLSPSEQFCRGANVNISIDGQMMYPNASGQINYDIFQFY